MSRPRTVVGALLALWLASAGVALSAPGDLDGTFGASGTALVDLGADEHATSLALQADGRIIVGGARTTAGPDGTDGIVARLTPQGALDTTYGGGGGWSRLNFSTNDQVAAVARQSGGRIIAVGTTTNTGGGFVAGLLNPAGTFDPAFGAGNGVFRAVFGATPMSPLAVAVQPDDRVVLAGLIAGAAPFEGDMGVARLSPGGAIDPTYGGGGGWSRVSFPGQTSLGEFGTGLGLQPDGGILVGGLTASPAGVSGFGVARLLNPQGTFDPTYGPGGNGTSVVPLGPIGLNGPALAMHPDGGAVLAGRDERSNAIVVRMRATGLPDTGFSDDGRAVAGPGSFGGVAAQRDGKIVAVGTTPAAGAGDVLVMRFQPNGQPDSTFSGDGRATVNLGGADVSTAVAIQPDGRIVVAARTDSNTDLVLLRFQGDSAAAGAGPGGTGPGGGPGGGSPAAPPCAGRPATVIGTPGRDRLRGTPGPDVIVGLGGNDVIAGLGGADLVCGGAGSDAITGGAGADRLLGQGAADLLIGGAGADTLLGGAGPDRLVGGGGRDVLAGGAGRNVTVQ